MTGVSNLNRHLPSYADVQEAAARIQGVAHRTPVMTSSALNEICGCEVFLKCENFQRMGAFKFRGGYNAMSRLNAEQRKQGVIAFSSGNHAQAVALSGKLLNMPCTIVMPEDAPQVKLNATRGYGAEVVLYDRSEAKREAFAERLQQERHLTLVPPFDHPHIISGQGTAAKELFEDVGPLDVLLTPCGGGGLLSGSALSAKALSPKCELIGVEPQAGNDGQRSFEAGRIVTIDTPDTIADGARTLFLGNLTFAIISKHVSRMLTASDDDLIHTMRFLWERLKIVVEPTAVLGLAPIFNGHLDLKGKRVGVILSGGNVDIASASELFSNS